MINEIIEIVKQVGIDLSKKTTADRAWTDEIKKRITDYGKSEDLYVCVGKKDIKNKDWGEWLYDITFLKRDANETIWEIPFVCESEWKGGFEIDTDFSKLVQARAKNKLMIFQAKNKIETDEIHNRLVMAKDAFNAKQGEEKAAYFYMCWNRESEAFEVYKK
jgi:hypothetical protein